MQFRVIYARTGAKSEAVADNESFQSSLSPAMCLEKF